MSDRVHDLKAMQTEVNQIKKRLTNKAKRQGIWEYFGQKEGRYLNDKYDILDREHSELLLEFELWGMDFDLSQI